MPKAPPWNIWTGGDINRNALRYVSLAVLLCAQSSALAQKTWSGASSDQWGTGTNWSPSGVPGYAADIIFDDTPGSDQTVFLGGQRQINTLTVDSSYQYALAASASWQTLIFVGSSPELSYEGSGDFTLSANINVNASVTTFSNTGTGSLLISGNIAKWSGDEVHFTGTGDTTFSGNLGGGIDIRISGTGDNTFSGSSFTGGTTVYVEGGNNTFDVEFGGGTTLDITGGDSTITNDIGGGASISVNVASGGLSIEGGIGGGADIAIESGELALSGAVASGASFVVESGGTLLLEDGVSIGNGSDIELDGGTLAVTADSVSIPNLTLTADSTIDLLDDVTANIYLGVITGDSVINIVNYVDTQQITFDVGSSSIDVPTQVFFNGLPGEVINGNEIVPSAEPVPEPGTVIFGLLLFVVLGLHFHVRRTRILNKTACYPSKATKNGKKSSMPATFV